MSVVPAAAQVTVIDPPGWVASVQPAPRLPAGIAQPSAGCVVVGYQLLADGSTDRVIAMGGAWTADVEEAQRQAFERDLLAQVRQWHFRAATSDKPFAPVFRTESVGFVAGATPGEERVVIGATRQSDKLNGLCGTPDLEAWGSSNAIPVEVARARHQAVIPLEGITAGYWTRVGAMVMGSYPFEAFSSRYSASVTIEWVIREDGVPDGLRVVSSKFDGGPANAIKRAFKQASLDAIARWRYVPGPENLDRVPVVQRATMTYSFKGDL